MIFCCEQLKSFPAFGRECKNAGNVGYSAPWHKSQSHTAKFLWFHAQQPGAIQKKYMSVKGRLEVYPVAWPLLISCRRSLWRFEDSWAHPTCHFTYQVDSISSSFPSHFAALLSNFRFWHLVTFWVGRRGKNKRFANQCSHPWCA